MLARAQEKLEKSCVEPVFISDEEVSEYQQLQEAITAFQKLDSLELRDQKRPESKVHQSCTEIALKSHQVQKSQYLSAQKSLDKIN